nr:PASTA domain-containing protein [Propionibacterium freudenreichii]
MVRKDELHAVISQGPQSYPMPTVVGLDKDAATRALADAHLRVGTIRQDYDADHAEGIVSGASASPGSQVRHDATVDLTVSRGPAPVKVPGLSGKTREDATAALDALGLKADVSTQHSDAVASGSVISQDPADGELRPGDTVKVVVSDGGAPTDVPDVRVRSTADAHKVLEAAGFHVDEVMVDPDARIRLGRVQRTDPDPGSKLPKGATVKIFII